MADTLNYCKISDLPIVEEVPEGATVLVYGDGALMRVDGSQLGGGGSGEVIIFNVAIDMSSATCNYTYAEVLEIIQTEICETPVAIIGGNVEGMGDVLMKMPSMCYMVQGDTMSFLFFAGGAYLQILYASDGTITVQQA